MADTNERTLISVRFSADSREAIQAFEQAAQSADTSFQRIQQGSRRASTSLDEFGRSAEGMSRATRGQVQNLAFQLQDFVVQVQAGTPVLTAFAQQSGQVLQGLGPVGAALGILVPLVAGLGGALLAAGGDAEEAADSADAFTDALSFLREQTADTREELAQLVEVYRQATAAQQTLTRLNLEARQRELADELVAARGQVGSALEQQLPLERFRLSERLQGLGFGLEPSVDPAAAERVRRAQELMRLVEDFQAGGSLADLTSGLDAFAREADGPGGAAMRGLAEDILGIATSAATVEERLQRVQDELRAVQAAEAGLPLPPDLRPPPSPERRPGRSREDEETPLAPADAARLRNAMLVGDYYEAGLAARLQAETQATRDAMQAWEDTMRAGQRLTARYADAETVRREQIAMLYRLRDARGPDGERGAIDEETYRRARIEIDRDALDRSEKFEDGFAQGLLDINDSVGSFNDLVRNGISDAFDAASASMTQFFMTGQSGAKELLASFAEISANSVFRYLLATAIDAGIAALTAPASPTSPAATVSRTPGGPSQRFAKGDVFDRPIIFPTSQGFAEMAEAGPESIMPLTRMPSGELGVKAMGSSSGGGLQGVTIIDQRGAGSPALQTRERQSPDGRQIEILIGAAVARQIGAGEHDRVMGSRFGLRPRPL